MTIAVAATLALVAVITYEWEAIGAVSISTAGYIALLAGGIVTFAVGAVLMFLIFYSNRAGFDDQPRIRLSNDEDGHQQASDET